MELDVGDPEVMEVRKWMGRVYLTDARGRLRYLADGIVRTMKNRGTFRRVLECTRGLLLLSSFFYFFSFSSFLSLYISKIKDAYTNGLSDVPIICYRAIPRLLYAMLYPPGHYCRSWSACCGCLAPQQPVVRKVRDSVCRQHELGQLFRDVR